MFQCTVHIGASIDSLPYACYMENMFGIASFLLQMLLYIYTLFSVYTMTFYKDTGGSHPENVRIFTKHNHMRAVVLLTMHHALSCTFTFTFLQNEGVVTRLRANKNNECFVTILHKVRVKAKRCHIPVNG